MVLQAGSRLLQWSPGFEVVIGSAKNCVQLFHQSSGRSVLPDTISGTNLLYCMSRSKPLEAPLR